MATAAERPAWAQEAEPEPCQHKALTGTRPHDGLTVQQRQDETVRRLTEAVQKAEGR